MLFRLSERRQKTISDILFFDSKSSSPVISDLSFWGQKFSRTVLAKKAPGFQYMLRCVSVNDRSSDNLGVHESCVLPGMSGFSIRFKGQCVLFSFVVTPLS